MWNKRALRPERPFKGVSGPSRPEIPKTSQKSLPRAPGPECPKSLEDATFPRLFWDFLTRVETVWTLRAQRRGETFLRLFGDFGPGGPGDFCEWPFGSQNVPSIQIESNLRALESLCLSRPWFLCGRRPCDRTRNTSRTNSEPS